MIESSLVILVDADVAALRHTEQILEGAGFTVMSVNSFAEARSLLASTAPELVIADIKLDAFNGLHLAALCALWHFETPFIATHDRYDRVLEDEAKRLNAIYVVKTPTRDDVVRSARTLLAARKRPFGGVRRFHRKAAPEGILASVAASSAEVVDVSYGGVRLKLPAGRPTPTSEEPPVVFDIVFPELELSLRAQQVWTSPDGPTGTWICGADISGNDSSQFERWRDFVDSFL